MVSNLIGLWLSWRIDRALGHGLIIGEKYSVVGFIVDLWFVESM